MLKLKCAICHYDIASITPDIKVPIIGAMFGSKDEKHGFPAPWSPVVTPEHMFCPMCQKRPFLLPEDGKILLDTNEGIMEVNKHGIFSTEDDSVFDFVKAAPTTIPNRGFTFTPVGEKVEKDIQSIVPAGNGVLSGPVSGATEESEEVVIPKATNSGEDPTIVDEIPVDEDASAKSPSIDAPAESTDAKGSEADPQGEEVEHDDAPPISGFDNLVKEGSIVIKPGGWYAYEGKNYRKEDLEKIVNG